MIKFESPELASATVTICEALHTAGGRAVVVGGSVRDAMLGSPAKDIDIEVYGLAPARLLEVLSSFHRIDLVGDAFGVIKIKGLPLDVSIPRRESKAGLGHKGFEIYSDPMMSMDEAARRRDFTINAMAVDMLTEELIDPYGGRRDLEQKVLRHTSDQFAEDPLRVLRAMQFAARFDFRVASETVELCRSIETEGLASERIFDEWQKLIVRGRRPSRGLQFLRDCGWVRYFPELAALIDCPQDPGWHPEGDVWTHTLHVMDAFAEERIGDEWEDLIVGLACLCHDFGKPATTETIDGRIRAYGHEEAGAEPTGQFLARLTNETAVSEEVLPLVVEHLKPSLLHKANAGAHAVRRLALRVGRIDRLVRVGRADKKGRPPLEFDGYVEGQWLLDKAGSMKIVDRRPEAIVMGRHLIDLGLEPGREFKPILNHCFEAQMDGHFDTLEGGIEFVRNYLSGTSEKT